MTVLDATKFADETELNEEIEAGEEAAEETAEAAYAEETTEESAVTFHRNRTITLDLPLECETVVKIYTRREDQEEGEAYRGSFAVVRSYNTNPHEQSVGLQALDATKEHGMLLGTVVACAADEAAWWLTQNSDDDDEKAKLALHFLEQWYDELDPDSVTEAIFDPLPEEEANKSEEVIHNCTCNSMPAPAAPAPTGVTSESQQHFEERKARLAWMIADGHMQLAEAKSRVKSLSKCIDAAAEQLETLIEDGPEEMPLFDGVKKPAAEPHDDDTTAATTPAATPVAADDDSWRRVLVADAGIPAPICKILNEDNQIYNLGQLADVTSEPNTHLTDLKKIGQAKAEKIEEALVAYWAAHPRTE